jgi:hypothetical protein
MKTLLVLLILAVFSTGCVVQSKPQTVENTPVNFSSDKSYAAKLKSIQTERQNLADEYRQSGNKKVVLEKASKVLVSSIYNEIFPAWYGTDWDFYGTTETPKQGKIACGYFVTTVLRDAGVKVQRVSLAQQASENIIKSLTTAAFIKRFHNAQIENFVADVKTLGEGLYIVGLDVHVGFILDDGNEVWFIHSSYVEPSEVIKEKALESPILSSSKYRVLGKISADNQFILKWLNQTSIQTYRR